MSATRSLGHKILRHIGRHDRTGRRRIRPPVPIAIPRFTCAARPGRPARWVRTSHRRHQLPDLCPRQQPRRPRHKGPASLEDFRRILVDIVRRNTGSQAPPAFAPSGSDQPGSAAGCRAAPAPRSPAPCLVYNRPMNQVRYWPIPCNRGSTGFCVANTTPIRTPDACLSRVSTALEGGLATGETSRKFRPCRESPQAGRAGLRTDSQRLIQQQ